MIFLFVIIIRLLSGLSKLYKQIISIYCMVEFVKFKKKDPEENSIDTSQSKPEKKSFFTFRNIIVTIVLFILFSILISSCSVAISPKIAVVPITGEISTQSSNSLFSLSASSRDISTQIYSLADDTTIKAIVLDINSPGGSPVASDEISQAVEYAKERKPVISVISDLGASGAYWIAASSDEIYSAPLSLIGSIGVTSATLSFENVLEEYNVTYRRLVAGEYKDLGTPFKELEEEEEKILQSLLDSVYEEFVLHVAKNRNMSYEEAQKLATGEVFLGKDSVELGLVDEIGYMQDVLTLLLNEHGNSTLVMQYDPLYSSPSLLGIREELGGLLQTQHQIPVELR